MEEQLFQACKYVNAEEVKELLQSSEIDINWQDSRFSGTPFYIACEHGHFEIVKLLLNDQRIEINKVFCRRTPFWIACSNGWIEIVKLLLKDERVDINKADRYDHTPFWISCRYGYIEIVKLLLSDQRVDIYKTEEDGCTPFSIACCRGHIEIVKLLLNDERIDVNKANKYGWTPFHLACRYGEIETVKLLLACRREIDINKKDGDGKTALDIAREKGNEEKREWESEEDFKNMKRNYLNIVELIESFERNQNETRMKLRIELGFAGKFIDLFIIGYHLSFLINLYL